MLRGCCNRAAHLSETSTQIRQQSPPRPSLKTIHSVWRIPCCQHMPVDVVKWLQILCVEKLFLEHVIYIINRRLNYSHWKIEMYSAKFPEAFCEEGRTTLCFTSPFSKPPSRWLFPVIDAWGYLHTDPKGTCVEPSPHGLPRAVPCSAPTHRCGPLRALPGTGWSVRIRCHPEVLDASNLLSLWLSISSKTQADHLVTLTVTATTRLPKQGPEDARCRWDRAMPQAKRLLSVCFSSLLWGCHHF